MLDEFVQQRVHVGRGYPHSTGSTLLLLPPNSLAFCSSGGRRYYPTTGMLCASRASPLTATVLVTPPYPVLPIGVLPWMR
eukprot:8109603-Heterocapsa_arctica.AAC.1